MLSRFEKEDVRHGVHTHHTRSSQVPEYDDDHHNRHRSATRHHLGNQQHDHVHFQRESQTTHPRNLDSRVTQHQYFSPICSIPPTPRIPHHNPPPPPTYCTFLNLPSPTPTPLPAPQVYIYASPIAQTHPLRTDHQDRRSCGPAPQRSTHRNAYEKASGLRWQMLEFLVLMSCVLHGLTKTSPVFAYLVGVMFETDGSRFICFYTSSSSFCGG